jgi:hypothetical protein
LPESQEGRLVLMRAHPSSLEVWQDVTVEFEGSGAFAVVSRSPGHVGELATLHIVRGERTVSVRVRVTESRLGVVDGDVRHLLRLAEVDGDEPVRDATFVAGPVGHQ